MVFAVVNNEKAGVPGFFREKAGIVCGRICVGEAAGSRDVPDRHWRRI